jgi:hypothetical protein
VGAPGGASRAGSTRDARSLPASAQVAAGHGRMGPRSQRSSGRHAPRLDGVHNQTREDSSGGRRCTGALLVPMAHRGLPTEHSRAAVAVSRTPNCDPRQP